MIQILTKYRTFGGTSHTPILPCLGAIQYACGRTAQ